MVNIDPIETQGRCVACNNETTEDNKVYWFGHWELDLCKNCFVQLPVEQIEALQTWYK